MHVAGRRSPHSFAAVAFVVLVLAAAAVGAAALAFSLAARTASWLHLTER